MDTKLPAPLEVVIDCVSLGSFDPEAMEEAIQKSQFEHYLDGPGRFNGKILQARNARTRLDWGRYNLPVLARGPVPADRMTLGVLLNDREESRFNGRVLSPGSMMLYDEGEELNVRLPPYSNWLSIQLDRPVLAEIGLEFSETGFRCWRTDVGRDLRAQLLKNVKFLATASRYPRRNETLAANEAINDVEDHILLALSELKSSKPIFSPRPSSVNGDQALRIVRDAADFMEENIEFPITIAEICLALDTNIKALERAFLRTYGLGPKQYLLKARLSKLRQSLMAGSGGERALVNAYLSCGLPHFGRAAQAYRALFGEPPSHTLCRPES